jgi:hypothetical protein
VVRRSQSPEEEEKRRADAERKVAVIRSVEEKWSIRNMGRTKQRQDVHEGAEVKCREQERNLKRVCAEGGKARKVRK